MKKIIALFSNNKGYLYALLVVIFSFSFLLNVVATIQLKYENLDLTEKIYELENRLLSAQEEIDKRDTDIYIYQEATERLGLVKMGEKPIHVNEIEVPHTIEPKYGEKEEKEIKLSVYLEEWYKDLQQFFN